MGEELGAKHLISTDWTQRINGGVDSFCPLPEPTPPLTSVGARPTTGPQQLSIKAMKYSSQLISCRDRPKALMGLENTHLLVKDRRGGGGEEGAGDTGFAGDN